MGGGLESRCIGRVCGAHGAVRRLELLNRHCRCHGAHSHKLLFLVCD